MRRRVISMCAFAMLVAAVWQTAAVRDPAAQAAHGWNGKRRVSYQQQKDLFYNYYAQPGPFYNTPSTMYVSPQPVPARVGHTYVTYQPFMPHEYTYRHQRSYYTYNQGSGWTRTNVRYGTSGNFLQGVWGNWHYPTSNGVAALHQDFHFPGLHY
jgi:hypothetical protein